MRSQYITQYATRSAVVSSQTFWLDLFDISSALTKRELFVSKGPGSSSANKFNLFGLPTPIKSKRTANPTQ